jgi:hypothetical protein
MTQILHIESAGRGLFAMERLERPVNEPKVLPLQWRGTPIPDTRLGSKPSEIISVGRNEELLRLREKLLSRTGLRVHSMQPEAAETQARSPESRVWVFCSTVETEELIFLASSVHRYSPPSRLLLIEGIHPVRLEASLVDRVLRASDGDDTLLAFVSRLALAS